MNDQSKMLLSDDMIEETEITESGNKITAVTDNTEKAEENLPATEENINGDLITPAKAEQKEKKESKAFSFVSDCGEFFCYVAVRCLLLPVLFLLWLARFIWKHTALFRDAVSRMGKALWKFIMSPFIKSKRALQRTSRKIKEAKANGDTQTTFKLYMLIVKDALFGKRGIIVTLFNYAAPILALTFLIGVVGYATNTNYAIKLSVNGKFVGYIENEQVFTDAERIMQQRVTYMDGEEVIEMNPEYSLEMLGNQSYITKHQLANKMMELSDRSIEYAYGMYIGNKFYGALVDKTPVEQTTEKLLAEYRTGASADEEVSFEKEITYVPGLYLSSSIVNADEIINLITSVKSEAAYYTIEDGDSHYLICEKLGITMEELEILNPGIMDEDYVLRAGEKLLKNMEVPYLSVSISRTEVYDVNVPYDTEYTTDDEHYQGVNTTIQSGEYGTNQITAKVYYVNGEETKRTIIKTVRTKDPVTAIISQGTLPPQSSHYSSEEINANTKYIWPTTSNSKLCEWGWWDGGYYGHRGVDILGDYGSDIYAGASGTVIEAGWSWGGYGYYVKIAHPDGFDTLYAHCSELFVSVGQKVTQGQCIAAMGETGRAFGVHVHFEVWLGAERLNPRYYLNGLPELYASGYYY